MLLNKFESRVLREIREGKVATCFKLNLMDPRVVEIAALAGNSCVWLCNEHVPNDWLNLEHMTRAARIYGMDTIVRVSKGSYSDYLKPLEAGAAGIMVPHVNSAEEARKVVDLVRFHPLGHRPADGGNVDGRFCFMPLKEYMNTANREQFIILQIESPEGLANLEEIAAVPGYDFLFFGQGDFLHLSGKPGEIGDPVVEIARRKVEDAARRHGKLCMALGYRDKPELMRQRNYGIVTLGADIISLGEALVEAVTEFECQDDPDLARQRPATSIYAERLAAAARNEP